MKTSLRRALFVAAVVALATSVLAAPASATHGQPGEQLPFSSRLTAWASGIDFGTGDPLFGGRCSVPSTYVISWDARWQAPHLGSVTTVEFSHCSQWLSADEITFGDGVFTIMAANGDTLTGTYGNGSGSFQPDGSFPYTYEVTIAGGTGRFAGATGHVDVSGLVLDWETVTVVETWDGWITYDASQRSEP